VNSDPTEYMPIEETYSPMVHRINQGIRRRATHPSEPVAPPADVLIKYSHPPPELVSKTASELNTLIKAAGVHKGRLLDLLLELDLIMSCSTAKSQRQTQSRGHHASFRSRYRLPSRSEKASEDIQRERNIRIQADGGEYGGQYRSLA
jgi:hypothetical protein